MLKTIAAIAGLMTIAGAAQADQIRVAVPIQGKSPAVVRAEIFKASEAVCKIAVDPFAPPSEYDDCLYEANRVGLRQARHILTVQQAASGSVFASR